MPRQRRINIPGSICHVITRGINGTAIFKNRKDRVEFLTRLESGLEKTKSCCYAWALMNNHIHLLIRTGELSLSELMRKLLTGYAIYFNRKHKRSGYLFQNRYKSILCQEDTYFLELIRYIHLNPVRAGFIKELAQLNQYPWTGHSVIVAKEVREWQAVNEVLLRFADKKEKAVSKYLDYILDGWATQRRDDLIGGGSKRSAGIWTNIVEMKKNQEIWQGDERILGDGDFVNEVLKSVEEKMSKKEKLKQMGWDIPRLVREVCQIMSIKPEELSKRGRNDSVSKARSLIAYLGYRELDVSGTKLASFLKISQSAVSESIQRGEVLAAKLGITVLPNNGSL
ncbi:transposase [bacterium]|nr:transposase [bacterium]